MSSHIIGGDVTYELVSFNADRSAATYALEYIIYRDTAGIGYDQLADFGIYRRIPGQTGWEIFNLVRNLPIGLVSEIDALNDPCKDQKLSNLIIESAVYNFEVTLDVGPYEYMIAYQRCCRNATINNIFDPNNTGAVYDIIVTPMALQVENSSPVFKEYPPIFVCLGEDFNFDHSAIDINGDSLAYTFCTPFASGANPDFSVPAECCFCTKPDPNVCMPGFANVEFIDIYSEANPVGGDPQIGIDPITGKISGVPNLLGSYVVGVCVEEYREGILIGTYRRDFEFNVEICTPRVVADLESDESIPDGIPGFTSEEVHKYASCGEDINIENLSTQIINIYDYKWMIYNENDALVEQKQGQAIRDVSLSFSNPGLYQGYMVINDLDVCVDTAFFQIEIYPPALLDFNSNNDGCEAGPLYLENTSSIDPSKDYNWLWIYKNDTISTDVDAMILEPVFGLNKISLKVTDELGCITELEKEIVYEYFNQEFIIEEDQVVLCPGDSINFDGEIVTDAASYQHIYTSSADGCDSLIRRLTVEHFPQPTIIEIDTVICNGETYFFDGSFKEESGSYIQSFQYQGASCDSIIYQLELTVSEFPIEVEIDTLLCHSDSILFQNRWLTEDGAYMNIVKSGSTGCDSFQVTLNLSFEPEVILEFKDTIICAGDSVIFGPNWYAATGLYQEVYLSTLGCDRLIEHLELEVRPPLQLDVICEDSISPYLDYPIDVYLNSEAAFIQWSPSEGLSCDDCLDPIVNISEDQTYLLEVEDDLGCRISKEINFYVDPLIDFYVPNIVMKQAPFNPVNEFFFLHVNRDYSFQYNAWIYDRWGSEVGHLENVTTNVADDGWSAKDFLPGVYVYYIEILGDIEFKELVGDLTVVK